MNSPAHAPRLDLKQPIRVGSREFLANKYAYYPQILEEAPICAAKISVLKLHLVTRHEDCVAFTKDSRFVRNRSTGMGGRRLPFPMPKAATLVASSMITEDDPAHRRLRNLINQAFTPRAVARLAPKIETLAHRLLDEAEKRGQVDLLPAYAQPIPVAVIADLVGVPPDTMGRFKKSVRALTAGFSPMSLLRTLFWDLRAGVTLIKELIALKRSEPGDDLLTALIQAEDEGDRLTEDELISLVFLLVIAGYETTAHLINNAVLTLLQHPEQLARLRAEPELMKTAVEEVLRYRGPIHGTKLSYAREEVTICGATLKKGSAVIPLLGAANQDPRVFERPEVFNVSREHNPHLGFSHGAHFCLGAQLARLETSIALRVLIDRNPNLGLAVAPEALKLQNLPLWHRYESLPVTLG